MSFSLRPYTPPNFTQPFLQEEETLDRMGKSYLLFSIHRSKSI